MLYGQCFGLDNNVAHPELTNAAIELTGIDELKARGNFDISVDPQCSFIDEGSVKEDYNTAINDWNTSVWGTSSCGLGLASSMNHSYNPQTGDGWSLGVGTVTINYIEPIWNDAWWNYMAGNYGSAYFALGRVCHLIEDMVSPAHVHGDVHLDGDDFENWGESHFGEYDFASMQLSPYTPRPGTVTLGNGSVVAADSIKGILHSMAKYTYSLSAFQGHLVEINGSQPDSELARMFPSLHFYDAGFFGDDCWEIDNIGVYDKVFNEEWWPCEGDHIDYNSSGTRHIEGLFYIENSAGDNGNLTPAVFEKPSYYQANPNSKSLLRIYGDVLYPEAIRYCAGAMVQFVSPQGDLDFDKDIDFEDFAMLASGWLSTDCTLANNWCDRTDMDADGIIGISDLNIFAENWLTGQ